MPSSDLITIAAIILGFGINVVMFRVNRELSVRDRQRAEKQPEVLWVAGADWLIFLSGILAMFGVIFPLLAFRFAAVTAAPSCAAALMLQVGYVPAILAHYRIGIGRDRVGTPTQQCEPKERITCWAFGVGAAVLFMLTIIQKP